MFSAIVFVSPHNCWAVHERLVVVPMIDCHASYDLLLDSQEEQAAGLQSATYMNILSLIEEFNEVRCVITREDTFIMCAKAIEDEHCIDM